MHRATELRNESTDPEIRLWNHLRLKRLSKVRFRRQHAIGRYVVDFCAPDEKVVIELDGSQHIEQADRDEERTRYLEAQGYRVLRFWNNEVLSDINGVVGAIQAALGDGAQNTPTARLRRRLPQMGLRYAAANLGEEKHFLP